MNSRTCADPKCGNKFKPVAEWHEFCSERCAIRVRVRRYRARKLGGDDGGGPDGGKRQPRLFPISAMHRRKAAKSALKPKQDGLFPDNGQEIFGTLAVGTNDSGVLVIGR